MAGDVRRPTVDVLVGADRDSPLDSDPSWCLTFARVCVWILFLFCLGFVVYSRRLDVGDMQEIPKLRVSIGLGFDWSGRPLGYPMYAGLGVCC